MRIAIDIDSTLHHYWDQFARAAKTRFGVDLPYGEQHSWHVSLLRPEQLRACVRETHRAESVLAAKPYEGAVETVRRWHEAGHFIHVTSHRATECAEATQRWLAAIGLPYDELYCSWDKVARCQEIGIDVLIDDSPVNIERALDAGMTVATISHPWNRDLCETEDVLCAKDWAELAELLEPVLGAGSKAA
jgi:beta-phosphoglucomutase-like phosphatase (HAD superfamily)